MSPDWSQMWQLDGQGFVADAASSTGNWLNDYIHPDDQPQLSAAIAESIKTKSLFELEHRVKRVDGSLGWILASRAAAERCRADHRMVRHCARCDLTPRGGRRSARATGARTNFSPTLAHELRNPLDLWRNGLEIAKKDSKPGSPFERVIEMMERQLNHLVHLVDDLMDVGRISTGKIELRRERVNLRKVLVVCAETCRAAIENMATH